MILNLTMMYFLSIKVEKMKQISFKGHAAMVRVGWSVLKKCQQLWGTTDNLKNSWSGQGSRWSKVWCGQSAKSRQELQPIQCVLPHCEKNFWQESYVRTCSGSPCVRNIESLNLDSMIADMCHDEYDRL